MLTYLFLTTIYSLEAQRVSIGLKGGPNYSRVNGTGPGYLTLGGLLGYNAGVFGLFKYPKLGIQPEVIFLSQGTETEFIALPTEVLKLNYICIPVMTKFYPANGFYIQAGPQFGYLISAKSNGANGRMVSTGQTLNYVDITSNFKSSNISLDFGFGWDTSFGLVVDVRYLLGLTNINLEPDYQFIETRTIQFSVGYRLVLGKH